MQRCDKKIYRVQHLAESDDGGGAVKAAFRLHMNLRDLGVDSHFLVADKKTAEPTSVQLPLKTDPISRYRRRARRRQLRRSFKPYFETKSDELEIFTHGRGIYGRDLIRQLPSADVYALHWADQLIDYRLLFKHLRGKTSVVWRLPDMNAMTGGCHYAWTCDRFVLNCGGCPLLGSQTDKDPSRSVFEHKRRAYGYLDPERTCFVAPSRWMQREAQRSSLLGRFNVTHIPTGVNCETFRPKNGQNIRERYGLPNDVPLVLFVAHSTGNYRKGFDLLTSAFGSGALSGQFALAAIGNSTVQAGLPEHCFSLGRISDPNELADLYSAADLFVHPAREENFPNVVLEAMACGTPSVAFDVGGLPDIVRHGKTGLLVPREDTAALMSAIQDLISDTGRLEQMSGACRQLAVDEYREDRMTEKYRDLYESLLPRARTR